MASYSLEDIIHAEVAKAVRGVAGVPEPDNAAPGINVSQIIKLLTEVNKLIDNIKKERGGVPTPTVTPTALPETVSAPATPEKGEQPTESLYEKLVQGLDLLAENVGEMTVRELRDYAKEHRDEVIPLIEGFK